MVIKARFACNKPCGAVAEIQGHSAGMKWLLITGFASLVIACASTRLPYQRTGSDAPIPTKAMARRHDTSIQALRLGHSVYLRKCGQCHVHYLPDEVRSPYWHVVVPGMAWNAGISQREQGALLEYITAVSRDAFSEKQKRKSLRR